MIEILLTILIYTVIVLIFVPLSKIGKAQDWVKAKVKQLQDKLGE